MLQLYMIYPPALKDQSTLNITTYLCLPVSFILSYIFLLLTGTLSFQLEFPLTFLGGCSSGEKLNRLSYLTVFPFNISMYYPTPCLTRFLMKKSADRLTVILRYNELLSLAASKILSLFLIFDNVNVMCVCISLDSSYFMFFVPLGSACLYFPQVMLGIF